MNKLAREVDAALRELELDTAGDSIPENECWWNTICLPCLPSALRAGEILTIGGQEHEVVLSLIILERHLHGCPEIGDTILYRERMYEIIGTQRAPGGAAWRFDLASMREHE